MIDSRSPTLAEVVRRAMDHRLSTVHVAMPAIVQSYDAATQTCAVKPAILQQILNGDGEEETQAYPVINNVPVAGLRFGSWFIVAPLAQGDSVMLQFAERSIDNWRALGGVQDPVDLRMHDLADAIALPVNVYPDAQAIPTLPGHLVIGKIGGSSIHLKNDGSISLGSETPAQFVALAGPTGSNFGAVKTLFQAISAPTIPIPPADPATTTAYAAAIYAAVTALLATGWPANVAATKVRAD